MKKALVCLVVLNCFLAPIALAADPDFWGVDAARQNIAPTETWVSQDDGGWTDGFSRFPDLALALRWIFGHWTKIHW